MNACTDPAQVFVGTIMLCLALFFLWAYFVDKESNKNARAREAEAKRIRASIEHLRADLDIAIKTARKYEPDFSLAGD